MNTPDPVAESIRRRLADTIQGQPVNVIQRGPRVFVDVVGPMTASTAADLADVLLPVVGEIVAGVLEETATHKPTPLDYPAHLTRLASTLRARTSPIEGPR